MKLYFNFIAFVLILLLSSEIVEAQRGNRARSRTTTTTQQTSSWQGSWETTYGELRLHQQGNKVYGDYANIGTIEASYSSSNKTLTGTFTNQLKQGSFSFQLKGNKFTGTWKWSTGGGDKWTGTKKSTTKPQLKNYYTIWQGSWETTYGELRLHQSGNKVHGDYADRGNIDATYNPANSTLTGTFTNKALKGTFSFQLKGNKYTGTWKWSTGGGDKWNGSKKNTSKPTLTIYKNTSEPTLTIYKKTDKSKPSLGSSPTPTIDLTTTPFTPPSQAPHTSLTGFFKCSDGGYYYLKQAGNYLYWFGEHPDGHFANVYKAGIIGNVVGGNWWDVAKGRTRNKGYIQLKASKDKNTLTYLHGTGGKFGGRTWTRTSLPKYLPSARSAQFSDTNGNLSGSWSCNDNGRYYVYDDGKDVAWVGEASFSNGQRPGWVNVFIGQRNRTHITGDWADVPKGRGGNHGTIRLSYNSNTMRRTEVTGGFSGTNWSKTIQNCNINPNMKHWRLVGEKEYSEDWTEECQGVTTDGQYWYITSNDKRDRRAVYKYTIDMKFVAKFGLEGIKKQLNGDEEHFHVGDLTYYKGNLYIPLENPQKLMILSTDFKTTKFFNLRDKKNTKPTPMGNTFAWCAIDPRTGLLYTSDFGGDGNLTNIYIYAKKDHANYTHVGNLTLKERMGRVQGGVITENCKLILADDYYNAIKCYSLKTGAYYGKETVQVDKRDHVAEEIEGLCISPPGSIRLKGVPVQVHLILLDNDKPDDDDVIFKHYAVPIPADNL